jgi:pyruvate formate lyase activating enzyme
MAEIAADKSFYHNTGGGATFSGGEPFLQPDFLAALAGLCREGGIHTAVETAGNIDYDCITPVLPLIDLVICDLKAVDERLHRGGTGVSNGLILENITRLSRNAAKLWVRVPLIPGYNDSVDELERIGNFLSGIEAEKVELMAYHRLGIAKYESLGLSAPTADLKPPETADMARARDCVQAAMKIGVVTIS